MLEFVCTAELLVKPLQAVESHINLCSCLTEMAAAFKSWYIMCAMLPTSSKPLFNLQTPKRLLLYTLLLTGSQCNQNLFHDQSLAQYV